MMFLADESIDRQIVEQLREEGHTVFYVAEMDPGISDDSVLSLAIEKHLEEIQDAFSVISPSSIRIRKLA